MRLLERMVSADSYRVLPARNACQDSEMRAVVKPASQAAPCTKIYRLFLRKLV